MADPNNIGSDCLSPVWSDPFHICPSYSDVLHQTQPSPSSSWASCCEEFLDPSPSSSLESQVSGPTPSSSLTSLFSNPSEDDSPASPSTSFTKLFFPDVDHRDPDSPVTLIPLHRDMDYSTVSECLQVNQNPRKRKREDDDEEDYDREWVRRPRKRRCV